MTSFDDVVSLLVSDRVKFSLTELCLKYVLSVENSEVATRKINYIKSGYAVMTHWIRRTIEIILKYLNRSHWLLR